MTVPINAVVDEAIRFEQNLATLYQMLRSIFADDADFWWELSVSEEEHARLLEAGRTLFEDEFSRETIPADFDALRESNDTLESTLDRFAESSPSREEAFRLSLALESDQNELTLHRLLQIEPSHAASQLVDRIRKEDGVHQQQIRDYAGSCGIEL
jgi:hypothetical protein